MTGSSFRISLPNHFAAAAEERAAYRETNAMQNISKKPSIRVYIDDHALPTTFCGRVAWTLDRLITAGDRGITSFENPAPRLSDYVFKLRKAGLDIETIDEGHKGAFAGVHGRYKLRSRIRVLQEFGVAA